MTWFLLWLGLPHWYVSTGCLHNTPEGHYYCANPVSTLTGRTKKSAECKHCRAPCRCRCHRRKATP